MRFVGIKSLFVIMLTFSISFSFAARSENYGGQEEDIQVDLQRYSGEWYEIASIPQRFSKGCTGTIAEYQVTSESSLSVRNSCFDQNAQGDQPGVFIPLPRLDLHGKLLPIRSTGFWNGGPVS